MEPRAPGGGSGPAATQVASISTTSHSWLVVWADTSREPSQVICLGVDKAQNTVFPMIQDDDGLIVSAYLIDPNFRLVMMSA